MRIALSIGLIMILCSCASCDPIPDTSVGAAEGRDASVILSGCGQRANEGYVFCKVREGALPSELIRLTVPSYPCSRDYCAEFIFVNPDGSFGYGSGIRQGQSEFEFSIGDMRRNQSSISISDEAEYAMAVRIYYNQNGVEISSTTRGYVRLHVLRRDYIPLVCNDVSASYKQRLFEGCEVQYSTRLRSKLCGEECFK